MGRRCLRTATVCCEVTPRFGELFLSVILLSDGSRTDVRMGDVGGNISSMGFLGFLTRLGDPDGLAGRIIICGEKRIWPAPFTPGMLCVLDMGGASEAVDLDLECALPDKGEVVLGL